ncbi:MAG: hypothetical protein H5T49_04080 [Hadesarchaea archaeon]|nr:hypothetical protein [Hadesarchaea archaeon]
MEYITREQLPEKLVCPSCGSRHIKIYGARKVEYELEEEDGEKVCEVPVGIGWDIVYSVECMVCGNCAEPDEIQIWKAETTKKQTK